MLVLQFRRVITQPAGCRRIRSGVVTDVRDDGHNGHVIKPTDLSRLLVIDGVAVAVGFELRPPP